MKRFLFVALLALAGSVARSQEPCTSLALEDICFVRQNFERNFYNSRLELSCLNMQGTDLFLDNAANLVVTGTPALSQHGGALLFGDDSESVVRVGAFHPYGCYDVRFGNLPAASEAGICFSANDGTSALKVFRSGEFLVADLDGKVLGKVALPASEALALRVQYTGARFHVFVPGECGDAPLLMSVACDKRDVAAPVKWSWGVYTSRCAGARLLLAESYISSGTGQADPQIVQNADGTPLIRDGRLYVCFTTRGFEKIPDSYQGVYSLGLAGFDLKLEGALFFGEGDGKMMGYHATKVVRADDGSYLVMTTTHGGTKHTLAWAQTDADILHGLHYLECRELDFPHNDAAGKDFNTEDPDFFYDAKARRWRLAYCSRQGVNKDGKHLSYVTHLCESKAWNGPYRLLATSTEDNNTGIRITSVGGRRYVLSGGPDTTFYIYDYPSLKCVGSFRQQYPNGGFRGWPTIVALPYGNYERYLWITFDRGALTGRYSYGTLYFYLADKMWKKNDNFAK